jgi:tRNA pseudouridine38-40 synthase
VAAYRLKLAYDGGPFAGWAAQPGLRTVQGELEAALERILGGRRVELTVAGRTDAGVHALGQVASFELDSEPPDRLAERLNSVLPREIAVITAEQAPDGFDARRDARSRTYCYRVLHSRIRDPFEEGRSLRWPHHLDLDALGHCAAAVIGSHDFTAFTPTETEHVRFGRDVRACEWRGERARLDGDLLELWIEADAFMRHMVRVLAGTMLEVGAGRRSLEDFLKLLQGASRDRAGETAPPHGLYLASIGY